MTTQEARALWVEALESGKYKQGTWRLYNNEEDSYCCLGVACVVLGQEAIGRTLNDQPKTMELLGLTNGTGSMKDGRSLVTLNDSHKSFKEIAAIIRSEPEGLFVNE